MGTWEFDLAPSHPILTEYEEVVARLTARYLQKIPTDWLPAIRQSGHFYAPTQLASVTVPDPDDEMFIEGAIAARADYVVTGDKSHLLALKKVLGIPIIAASDFSFCWVRPKIPHNSVPDDFNDKPVCV